MRTSLIVSIIISVLLNIALFVFAYDGDTKAKEWKAKYFNAEKIANDQQGQAAQLTLDKNKLLDELNKINKRVENTNAELAAMSKELADQRSQFEQKTKELEINKQISNLPFSCPSIVQPPKKKIVKRKKRIPYDIAPSQQ
jgi:Skp family chaperone for outer membrane proteins